MENCGMFAILTFKRPLYNSLFFISHFVLINILLVEIANAQVYEWTDPRGVRHFSSKKDGEQFREAELPPILREKEVKTSKTPSKSAVKKLVGCGDHGGINCQAGPDGDGSVVCLDGFRDATTPHRFGCLMAKLTISELLPGDEQDTFKLIVRNEAGMVANNPKLTLPAESKSATVKSPDSIQPFEVGEFILSGISSPPIKEQIVITCDNCG